MFRITAATFALALVLFSAASPAVTSAAETAMPSRATSAEDTGVGIGLIDVPVDGQNDPRARSYIVDHMTPGSTIQRRVRLVNDGSTAQSVRMYSSAAEIVDDVFTPGDADAQNDVSRWTTFDQDTVELAPMGNAEVLVTVDVPADAAAGEQYGAVWAEVRSTSVADTNIVTANRVGIRMYLSVGPGNGPAADFSLGAATATIAADGTRVFTIHASNTGGRALDLDGSLTLTDGPAELSAGPFDTTDVLTLAPGHSGQLSVRLGKEIPAGPWSASLEARSGEVVHASSAEITFSTTENSVLPQDTRRYMLPLTVASGIALLLGIAALLIRARRRRKTRRLSHTGSADSFSA